MSAPGSAQPRPSTRPPAKIVVPAIILALLAIVSLVLPVKSINSEFAWGIRPVTIMSYASIGSMTRAGNLGLTDLNLNTWNLPVTLGLLILCIAGVVMLFVAKVRKLSGLVLAAAGLLTAGAAAYGMTASADALIGGGIDVNDVEKFNARAAEYGTVAIEAGAYIAIVAGLALIGLGIYIFTRPAVAPTSPAAYPAPHYQPQPYAPAPGQPVYNPAAHQQPHPQQPPTWPGQQGRAYPPQ